jgi:hypothetical protein
MDTLLQDYPTRLPGSMPDEEGTKMAADATLEANRTYESIRTAVETMLREAEK